MIGASLVWFSMRWLLGRRGASWDTARSQLMTLELSPHDRGHVDRGLHNDQPSVLLGQIFAGVYLTRLLRLPDAAD